MYRFSTKAAIRVITTAPDLARTSGAPPFSHSAKFTTLKAVMTSNVAPTARWNLGFGHVITMAIIPKMSPAIMNKSTSRPP